MSSLASSLVGAVVFPSLYRDSVALMTVASRLEQCDGVDRAGVVMGTPANLDILAASGMRPATLVASPDDVVVVVRATDDPRLQAALDLAADLISKRGGDAVAGAGAGAGPLPGTVAEGMAARPDAGILAVSTPGAHASLLIRQGLMAGLHVFCFSDNVPLADEVELKVLASARRLLLMGPDCGTALIDGRPLGFVNAVESGPVGIVSASGTGAQEVMCQLDRRAVGVSQVIGVGGRDLTAAVGGRMTDLALDLLEADRLTTCIVLVGKPPAPEVRDALMTRLSGLSKPAVACLVGTPGQPREGSLTRCATLVDAATTAAALVTGVPVDDDPVPTLRAGAPGILGLYTGGTLASEARHLLHDMDAAATVIDLGADEFTVGRPHPMIDPSLRASRAAEAGSDPRIGVLLLDLVLGHGATADPAGPLAQAVVRARARAAADGRSLAAVASVCGTTRDPQPIAQQRAILADAGVVLASSNAAAARAAGAAALEAAR